MQPARQKQFFPRSGTRAIVRSGSPAPRSLHGGILKRAEKTSPRGDAIPAHEEQRKVQSRQGQQPKEWQTIPPGNGTFVSGRTRFRETRLGFPFRQKQLRSNQ